MSVINGLPAHVLLVHAVVVLVPLTAVLVVAVAFWPAARYRLSVPTAVLAAITLALVPVTTDAGEWLEHHLPRTPLLRVHTELGDYMLPWAVALFVVAAAVAARDVMASRRQQPPAGPGAAHRTDEGVGGRPASVLLAALALLVAVGSIGTVFRIGESGSRAAWTGQFSPTPVGPARPPDAAED